MERVNSTIEVTYDGLIDIEVAGEETRFDSEDFSVHVSPEDGTTWVSTYVNVEHNGDDIEAITHLIIDDPSVARTLAAAIVKPFADDRPTGIDLIAAERLRQVEVEEYDAEHDSLSDGALVDAAVSYLVADQHRTCQGTQQPPQWPFLDEDWKPTEDDRVRELVKAGALIAAEIDRLRA